jgi:hypothetical protein
VLRSAVCEASNGLWTGEAGFPSLADLLTQTLVWRGYRVCPSDECTVDAMGGLFAKLWSFWGHEREINAPLGSPEFGHTLPNRCVIDHLSTQIHFLMMCASILVLRWTLHTLTSLRSLATRRLPQLPRVFTYRLARVCMRVCASVVRHSRNFHRACACVRVLPMQGTQQFGP